MIKKHKLLVGALLFMGGSISLYAIFRLGENSKNHIEIGETGVDGLESIKYEINWVVGERFGKEDEFFYLPRIAVDNYGHLYIADMGNNRILQMNENGQLIRSCHSDWR